MTELVYCLVFYCLLLSFLAHVPPKHWQKVWVPLKKTLDLYSIASNQKQMFHVKQNVNVQIYYSVIKSYLPLMARLLPLYLATLGTSGEAEEVGNPFSPTGNKMQG